MTPLAEVAASNALLPNNQIDLARFIGDLSPIWEEAA
jgi:hypothetical protein